MNHIITRRDFLSKSVKLSASVLLLGLSTTNCSKNNTNQQVYRLNPAFQIQEISSDSLKLFTFGKDGAKIEHEFNGLTANLIQEINKEQTKSQLIEALASKLQLDKKTCTHKIENQLTELTRRHLIYSGDRMIVKVSKDANAKGI